MNFIDIKGYQGTDVHLSRVAMGSAMSMMRLDRKVIYRLFDEYLDAGGNCLDTARAYGNGQCEEMVGDYLKQSSRAQDIVISTKGCHPLEDDMSKSRLSLDDLEHDINISLKTLHRDCIDMYWIHKDDESLPVEQIVDNINQIIKEGKAKVVGCSNWHANRIKAANEYAKASGQQGFLASQVQWSLVDTKEEYFKQYQAVVMNPDSYNWYLSQNMPVFAFSSQAQGFFSRIGIKGLDALPAELRHNFASPENLIRYERVKKIAQTQNVSISAVVLAYLTNNKLPSVAIIGAENSDMLHQSMESSAVQLSPQAAEDLFKVTK